MDDGELSLVRPQLRPLPAISFELFFERHFVVTPGERSLPRPVRPYAHEERARFAGLGFDPDRAAVGDGEFAAAEEAAAGAVGGGGVPDEAGLEDRLAHALGD